MNTPALTQQLVLQRYSLLEKIGSGGMGDVYLADDKHLDRQVAVKVLRDCALFDEASRNRLHDEALALSKLSHPNVAIIYDFDSENGTDFLVEELIPGEDLNSRLLHGPLGQAETLEFAMQIAEALKAAHREGIVHGDVKPGNLRITPEGVLKVLDFGLSRSLPRPELAVTTDAPDPFHSLTGTIPYMSPEQLRGEPAGIRSDIYSAGVVLYEMISGRRPFDHPLSTILIDSILHDRPTPLTERVAGISPFLDYLITKCLEKAPEHRYQSANDMLADIRRAMANQAKPQASLAVLYFEDLASNSEYSYFRDGMTEDIITELSRIADLRIFSRSAVLPYREHPAAASIIGQELGASHVLEGSIRRDGSRLRINVNLVEARTGHMLWAERFDRQFQDVFAIQDEIAHSIARALRVILTETEKRAIEKIPTEKVEAYDLYLRGRQFFHQFRRKGYDLAREMFLSAIEIDPRFARAYAGIADCSAFLYMYWDSTDDNLRKADEASFKALQLDPEMAEAHASRGLAAYLKKNFEEAQREFERAIRIEPRLFEPYYFSARTYYAQGKLEEAVKWFDKANDVQPADYQSPMLMASALNGLKREAAANRAYMRGLASCQKHLELHPFDARALYFGANALVQIGDKPAALQWVAKALELEPDEPQVLYNVACVYALLGERDKALDSLERSVTHGWEQREWMAHDPDFASLRGDKRFEALVTAPDSAA